MPSIAIILLLVGISLPIILFALIKPDGRYYCIMPGCNSAFEELPQFLEHLEKEHHFSDEMVDDVLRNVIKYRSHKRFW